MRSLQLVRERQQTRPAVGTVEAEALPSGPAAAVVLAAGVACFVLGALSILTAANQSVSDARASRR